VSSCLVLSLKKNLEFMDKLEELSEVVYNCVDVLEQQHRTIEEKTKIEVFSDEPIIKDLVEDMKIARNSVLKVAKVLDTSIEIIEE
jgi:hypothetical protein